MQTKPLITIIITNYNYGRYITKAINSVITQSYSNIELIIINDGSTDDSDEVIKEIIAKYPGRNIRYVNRENRGVVFTRNEGIKLAKGEYICYLDADDYFNRNYISNSLKIAQEFGADVVYPNWHFVGEWLGHPDTNFAEFTPELLQLQKIHCTPASLIKSDTIKNRRFEVEKVAEDWDFFIGLSLDGAIFKLAKDNFINYRIRKGTRGSKNDPGEDTKHFVDILKKYKDEYGDKVIDPARLVALRHPNIIMRILRTRLLLRIITSVKQHGIKLTAKKAVRKFVSKSPNIWNLVVYVRNYKYQKILRSFSIVKSPQTKLAIVVHLYYTDLWPLIKENLSKINTPFDLFVSVQTQDKHIELDKVSKYHKATNIVAFPNRGRDTLPFFLLARKISNEKQYEYLLKLHSKKSLHRKDGGEWLNDLLGELIPADTTGIIRTLHKANTGAIGPANHVVSLSRYMGSNKNRMKNLIGLISNEKTAKGILGAPSKYPFFGGTMFWCRVDFLRPLLDSKLTPSDFNSEDGQVDGTTAHAIERVLGRILHEITNKKMYTIKKSIIKELPKKSYSARYKHVD